MPALAARSRSISAPGASDRALSSSKPTSTDWMPARKWSLLSSSGVAVAPRRLEIGVGLAGIGAMN